MLKWLIVTWVGAGLLTALAAWTLFPLPTISSESSSQIKSWELPVVGEVRRTVVHPHYQAIRELAVWKLNAQQTKQAQVQAAAVPVAPPPSKVSARNWQLLGIVEQGPRRYVLLSVDNQVKAYPPSSRLPDDSQLLGIDADSIRVAKQGKTESVLLYETEQ